MKSLSRGAFALCTLATVALVPAASNAATLHFIANLDGLSESPPNASPAFGDADITINDTTFAFHLTGSFSGLLGGFTAGTINCCTAVAGAGTAASVYTLTSAPFGAADGAFDENGVGTAALLAGLGAGKAYLNIRSQVFPAGEIRGFFVAAPTPVPAALPLFASGLGVIGALRWRKKRKLAA